MVHLVTEEAGTQVRSEAGQRSQPLISLFRRDNSQYKVTRHTVLERRGDRYFAHAVVVNISVLVNGRVVFVR